MVRLGLAPVVIAAAHQARTFVMVRGALTGLFTELAASVRAHRATREVRRRFRLAIELRTLGTLQVHGADGSDSQSLLAQPRRVALLVYLALATPRGFQRRDRLLALFWPEQDEPHARNALSQAVHFLRRTLGADAIVSRADDEIRVEPALVRCDAVDFEAALEKGRIEEALALYRGPLLEGYHISSAAAELSQWIDAERDRLARRFASAASQLAAVREAAGDHAAAAHWYRRLAAADPLDSTVALGLMRALAASGDRTAAIRHARVHEAMLREELDASPDPRVVAFLEELQSASAAAPASPTAIAPTRTAPDAAMPAGGASPDLVRGTTLSLPHPPVAARASAGRKRIWTRRVGGAVAGLFVAWLSIALLTSGRSGRTTRKITCLAVLPLDNLSGDSVRGYLADALTDAIITEVARDEQLKVISRTSTMRYRRANEPLPQIGKELNCDGVLEGTISSDGRYLHVDAQILYAADDRHLWAESYEADTAQVLVLERRVADGVATHARLLAAVPAAPPATASLPADPVLLGIYLRGRDAFSSRNPASLRQAVALFNQAIARDSTFAPAYAGLADADRYLAGLGIAPFVPYVDSARMMARHALSLDSTLSEAHASLAALLTDDADWPRAEAEYQRAIALKPGNALAHQWYAMMLATLNRKDEALHEIRRAKELDPLSQSLQGAKTQIEFFAGVRVPLGNPGDRKKLIDPTHPGTIAARGIALARQGKCDEAYLENSRAQQLAPDNTLMMIGLVAVHLFCHAPDKARTLLEAVERRRDAPLFSVYIAEVYTAEQLPDSAFAWLDRGQWGMQARYELRIARELAPLRNDPRYLRLLHRIGLS